MQSAGYKLYWPAEQVYMERGGGWGKTGKVWAELRHLKAAVTNARQEREGVVGFMYSRSLKKTISPPIEELEIVELTETSRSPLVNYL